MSGGGPDVFDAFVEARAIADESERRSYVDRVMQDAEERALVHSLLRHDRMPGRSLGEMLGVRPGSSSSVAGLLGARVGAYRILAHLGSGGFADVYEAEQESPVRRRVALKVLKPYLVTPEVTSRFRTEQQALALMSHPCIASVYDAGETADGRPFFVLELVQGEPITRWAARTAPSRVLRLELLAKVCDAIQHAHEKGVVHRDIKPSNVLVTEIDGVPHPKVIDFGVAKALGAQFGERSIVTGKSQLIGTPGTMSPEQLSPEGRSVDERSDVYMLGALIFEVFTGRPLYDLSGLGIAAAIRLVSEGEPSSITRHSRVLGADLKTIVTTATATEPERRYGSARALRTDLLRARDFEPLIARPPSWIDRTARFARRNKGVVAATVAIILSLAAGLVVSTRQARRATEAEALARSQAHEYAAVTRDTVAALQRAIVDIPGTLPVNRVLVERTIAGLEALAHGSDDPAVAIDLARAYRQLARLQGSPRGMNKGDREASIASLERAVECIQPALGVPALASDASGEFLACLWDLGETRLVQRMDDRALEALLRGVEASEARLDQAPRDWIARSYLTGHSWSAVKLLVHQGRKEAASALIDRYMDRLPEFDPVDQVAPIRGENLIGEIPYLGTMLGLVGRFEEAERWFDRAMDGYRQVRGDDPAPSVWDQDIGNAHRHRALMRLRAGIAPGAVDAIRASIEALERARIVTPENRPLEHIAIDARVTASWAYLESGDPELAEAVAIEAVERAEPFLALEPDANMWSMIAGCALARAALAVEARCRMDPDSPGFGADAARALTYVDRALDLWSKGEPPGPLDDDWFGTEEAMALRERLVEMAGPPLRAAEGPGIPVGVPR